jgi:hypothetical protein
MFKYRLLKAARVALFVAMAAGVIGWVVMSLWNFLLPGLFGWRSISFAQALGVLILSRILFGSMRGPGMWGAPPWRRHLHARWEQMTPEERAKFREGLRHRCWGMERPEGPMNKV